jgi:hypothetical protein
MYNNCHYTKESQGGFNEDAAVRTGSGSSSSSSSSLHGHQHQRPQLQALHWIRAVLVYSALLDTKRTVHAELSTSCGLHTASQMCNMILTVPLHPIHEADSFQISLDHST